MSAGLYEYDWMFSVKERPWHGIGTVIEEAPNSKEAIKIAKLDWSVGQYPVYANDTKVEGYFANIREDINFPLGVVKGRYKVVQNEEAFSFVDDIINNGEVECKYETAGSLFGGKRIFLLVKLPNKNILGDDVENYLFFTNSHDAGSVMMAGISNVRVVCNNTLQLAMKSAERVWKCKHYSTIYNKAEEAKHSLGLAIKYIDEVNLTANEMAVKKVNFDDFSKKFIQHPVLKLISDKNKETLVSRVKTIYSEKDDLQNFKGSSWGIYNAVADYVSNAIPFRQTNTFEQNKLVKFFDGDSILKATEEILLVA